MAWLGTTNGRRWVHLRLFDCVPKYVREYGIFRWLLAGEQDEPPSAVRRQHDLVYEREMSETPRAHGARTYQLTIRQLLETPISDQPDEQIVYRGVQRFSYRQLRERVHRLAGALAALGVRSGDTVGVMDYDSHRYLEAFFAVPMMGAVLHSVNVRLSPEQILYTIEHAGDDVLLVHSDFVPLLESIRGRISTVKRFVLIAESNADPGALSTVIPFAGEYEALLASVPARFDFPQLDENVRATTFYTTATTGLPKGVFFSHRQLVLHTLAITACIASQLHASFRRGDVYMPLTPMFHVHAWGIPYVATMLGVKQVYPGRYAPEALLKLIVEEKVTFSHCVPTTLHMLLACPESGRYDLAGWKVLVGGAALPKSLAALALRRGIDVVGGYGLSESCPVLSVSNLDATDLAAPAEAQLDLRIRTGRALPFVDLQIRNGSEEVPSDGQSQGEIVVRAPWLTAGYLKDQKGTDRLWSDGYLHTGDVAHRDARGFVKITDRMKDIVKIGGEWLSSLAIEDVFTAHPGIGDVAVIAMPDAKWGERPLALVVPRPGGETPLTERDLVAHAREYVQKGVLPRQAVLLAVKLVEAIDRTSVGKVDKVALRKKYL